MWTAWLKFFLTALAGQADENAAKAFRILKLYEALKKRVIELTRSPFAMPMLDTLFQQPVFEVGQLEGREGLPGQATIMTLLHALVRSGIVKIARPESNGGPAVFALADWVNICEGRAVM